jgi:hypothetical protein
MPSLVRRTCLAPLWVAQIFTQQKFFDRNPVIGNRWLNERGLHAARVVVVHRLAARRRRRLAGGIAAVDRQLFDRDGFIVKRDFLPARAFDELRTQVRALRTAAREMTEGDTITRHIALAPAILARVPVARRLLKDPEYRNLIRYAASSAAAPEVYVQTILSHARAGAGAGPADPQLRLHADTFHPTAKAWLFLGDDAAAADQDAMPFLYVPGSHRLTPQRLAWQRRVSIEASRSPDAATREGSFRIEPSELAHLGLPPPRAIAATANTLIVADTFGFHARGPSARPTMRVEIWASARRNPFLPWCGLDPWSFAPLGLRKPLFYWQAMDLLERWQLGRQRWRARADVSAFDPA